MSNIFLEMNVYCAAILMIASKRWQEIIEIQIEGSAVETIFYKFPCKSQAPTKVKMEKETMDEAPESLEQVHFSSMLQLSVMQ